MKKLKSPIFVFLIVALFSLSLFALGGSGDECESNADCIPGLFCLDGLNICVPYDANHDFCATSNEKCVFTYNQNCECDGRDIVHTKYAF